MIEIKNYNKEDKKEWDGLIKRSRADTFLFYRDFMDYHSSRFKDHSFLIFRKGKLEGLLPGNIQNDIFYSHQGLTYGGLITTTKMTTIDVIRAFELINNCLRETGVTEVIYKPLPFIYQIIPAQEDIYALFRLKAEKIACNISSTIFQKNKIAFVESRKAGIRKGKRSEITINETQNLESFWKILENNLKSKFEKKPVHSINEIKLLKSFFPANIKLYTASKNDKVLGGVLLFIMNRVIHVQYIAASQEGKENGVLDLLFDELINHIYAHIPVFDFGQSTEKMGDYLNEQLIFQKESFGGRGIVYETYKYSL